MYLNNASSEARDMCLSMKLAAVFSDRAVGTSNGGKKSFNHEGLDVVFFFISKPHAARENISPSESE